MKQIPYNATQLHPACREKFVKLAIYLEDKADEIGVLFRPFEGYRSPERQEFVFKNGTSKAHAWYSAHQYGLAVDFVPVINGVWNWSVSRQSWDALKKAAEAHGLFVPISWDSPHVEATDLWKKMKAAL